MSNYLGKAKNPNTGNLEDCEFLDDFYGKRQYAVRFKDGTTYPESEVEGLPMNEHKPEPWEEFVKEFSTKEGSYLNTGITKTELMTGFIRTLLTNQNTANAERMRGEIKKIERYYGNPKGKTMIYLDDLLCSLDKPLPDKE